MKIIYLNFGVKNYRKVDHCSYRCNFLQLQKERLKKNSGLYRIRTLDLCDTGAALLQITSKLGADRYMWTVGWIRIIWKYIIAVIDATFTVFFFWLSFCNCCVVISNPAYTISNSKHETSVAPSAIIDTNLRDLPWRNERYV